MSDTVTMILCPKCSAGVEVTGGVVPRFCPNCGGTFGSGGGTGLKVVALAVFGAGALAVAAAAWRGVSAESGETALLSVDVQKAERELVKARKKLDELEQKAAEIEEECTAADAQMAEREAEIRKREEEVLDLEKGNRKKVGEARSVLETARKGLSEMEDQARAAVADREREEKERAAARARIENSKLLVVTLNDRGRKLRSGFLLDTGAGAVVVTTKDIVTGGRGIWATFRQHMGSRRVITAHSVRSTVRYQDDETGLIFVIPEYLGNRRVRTVTLQSIGSAKVGQDVYAVTTNVLGGAAFADTVLDGSVSSVDRKRNGISYIQTTIPCNEGSEGAPIFARDGKLVGVMMSKHEGMEKSSLALAGKELATLIVRYRAKSSGPIGPVPRAPAPAARTPAPRQRPKTGFPLPYDSKTIRWSAVETAGRALKLPYDKYKGIPVRPTTSRGLVIFAGPSDLLIAYHPRQHRLSAYKAGQVETVWEYALEPQSVVIAHQQWEPEVLTRGGAKKAKGVNIDLRTGRKIRLIPDKREVPYFSSALKMGSFWVTFSGNGFGFMDRYTFKEIPASATSDKTILGRNRGVLLYLGNDKFGRVDAKKLHAVCANLVAAEEARRNLDKATQHMSSQMRSKAYQDLGKRNAALREQEKALYRDYFMPGAKPTTYRWAERTRHIPGTYRVILETNVWEIGDRAAKRIGEFSSPQPSGWKHLWYHAFLKMETTGFMDGVVNVSPDGKYALTQTHLFDLKTLKPLAELPIPAPYGGFLSSGKTAYFYDKLNQKVWFIEVEKMLSDWRKPAAR